MNKKKKKTYINIAVLALIIAGTFYVLNEYLYSYIKNISSEIIDTKKNAVIISERNNKIDEVRSNYTNIEKEIGIISSSFVKKDNEEMGKMFLDLENLAEMYSVELAKSPTAKPEEKMGKTISVAYFNIALTGEYDDIMKYLLHLDNFRYYLDLNNIEMVNSAERKENMSKITLRGELVVYIENKN